MVVAMKTQFRIYIQTRTLARPKVQVSVAHLRKLSTISEESGDLLPSSMSSIAVSKLPRQLSEERFSPDME